MFHLIARVCWYVCTCLSRSLLFSHGLSKCFSLDCMMLKTKNRKRDTDIFLWKRIFENFLTNSWAWDITYFSCSDFLKLWANLLKNERGCSNVFSEKQFKIKDFYIDFGVISPFRTHRLYTKKAIKNEILELTVALKVVSSDYHVKIVFLFTVFPDFHQVFDNHAQTCLLTLLRPQSSKCLKHQRRIPMG